MPPPPPGGEAAAQNAASALKLAMVVALPVGVGMSVLAGPIYTCCTRRCPRRRRPPPTTCAFWASPRCLCA
ncbi:MAG: hypothetical protein ACLUNQ_03095 [Oscillospiraceae bacterium]